MITMGLGLESTFARTEHPSIAIHKQIAGAPKLYLTPVNKIEPSANT